MQPDTQIWYRRMTGAGGRFSWASPVSYPYRHHLGRETFLAPVSWTADGWPVIGNGGRVEAIMEAPQLPAFRWADEGGQR